MLYPLIMYINSWKNTYYVLLAADKTNDTTSTVGIMESTPHAGPQSVFRNSIYFFIIPYLFFITNAQFTSYD